KKALYFIDRLLGNLILPTDEPSTGTISVRAFAEAILARETRKTGRPRKHKERVHIKVSSEVASYLRSLKGGDDGFSGYLETLIRADPHFAAWTEHPTISCA